MSDLYLRFRPYLLSLLPSSSTRSKSKGGKDVEEEDQIPKGARYLLRLGCVVITVLLFVIVERSTVSRLPIFTGVTTGSMKNSQQNGYNNGNIQNAGINSQLRTTNNGIPSPGLSNGNGNLDRRPPPPPRDPVLPGDYPIPPPPPLIPVPPPPPKPPRPTTSAAATTATAIPATLVHRQLDDSPQPLHP